MTRRRGSVGRPGAGGVAVLGALVAAIAVFVATADSYFYADDWGNLGLARDHGMGRALLTERYFGHLAPGHRVLDWFVASTGFHFAVAQLTLLALLLIGAAGVYDVTRRLSERPWLAAALTVAFAASPIWVRTIEWPASGNHIVGATAASLWCIAAALRWFEGRRWVWFAASLLAFLIALTFYEKPLLVPAYLFFLRYGAIQPHQARSWAQARQDLPLWIGLAALGLAWLAAISSGGGVSGGGRVGFAEWIDYARIVWLQGSGPLILGGWSSPDPSGWLVLLVIVAAQVTILALAALSVWLRPAAWRAWAFYVVALAVNAALIGSGRLGDFGAGIGYDLRYNSETSILLPLTLACAFTAHQPSGRRVHVPRGAVVAGGLAISLLFLASTANAFLRLREDWPADQARTYVQRTSTSARALGAVGETPRATVIDQDAPPAVFGPILQAPYQRLSQVMSMADADVVFERPTGQLLAVAPDGRLQPLRQENIGGRRWPAGRCLPQDGLLLNVPARGGADRASVVELAFAPDSPEGNVDLLVDRGNGDLGILPVATVPFVAGQTVRASLGIGPVARVLARPIPGQSPCITSMQVNRLDPTG